MGLNLLDSAENVGIELRESFTEPSKSTLTSEQSASQDFNKWLGYYDSIPEVQAVIDKLALWVVFGGDDQEQAEITFKSKSDEEKFKRITGYGKDTPEDVAYNLFRTGKIGGTTVGEIIRGNKKGLINLKPLDPQTIMVKANKRGIIESFEQVQAKSGSDGMQLLPKTDFKPDQIFYIAWNRIADEIVGIPTIKKLTKIIDYRHQAMEDLAEVFHRYVVPFWLFYVDTDDETEIATFKTKVKQLIKNKDHMVIPADTVKNHERLSVPQFSTLDPLNWIKHLERYFLMSEGVPEIISGIGRETADASSRLIYLSWRIVTIANQKMYEKHWKIQLGIDLKFPRPVNILAPVITPDKQTVKGTEKKKDVD